MCGGGSWLGQADLQARRMRQPCIDLSHFTLQRGYEGGGVDMVPQRPTMVKSECWNALIERFELLMSM
eukprot:1339373-Lingulodinium_polyedra.AAC.1